jgi:ribonuclease HII
VGARVSVGIDENGLGPRLGPLVVTAVAARVTEGARGSVLRSPSGVRGDRIGDSKRLVSFGDSDLGEAWAHVLAARAGLAPAASPDELVQALSIESREVLHAPCPDAHRQQCWSAEGEAFASDPKTLAVLTQDAARLEKRGLSLLGAHVAIVCTQRINEQARLGISRFELDLHAMERLLLYVRARHDAELDATCGKVGGYNSYPRAFGPLSGRLFTTIEEGRARSAYRIAGLGEVAFVRDADDSHVLVALASLVGKWARDFLMKRITRYHRKAEPSLEEVSGYHDPVTARFVEASALSRRARGVPDTCFEREKSERRESRESPTELSTRSRQEEAS